MKLVYRASGNTGAAISIPVIAFDPDKCNETLLIELMEKQSSAGYGIGIDIMMEEFTLGKTDLKEILKIFDEIMDELEIVDRAIYAKCFKEYKNANQPYWALEHFPNQTYVTKEIDMMTSFDGITTTWHTNGVTE